MHISQWRTGLKTWLTNCVGVNSWDLRNPTEYGTTNGFIAPLQGLVFVNGANDYCMANQDIYITSRYRGDVKYSDLPLGDLEQFYVMIARRLVTAYADIAPLQTLEMVSVPECISVQEYGDDLADWLVTLMFSVNITWVPDKTPLLCDSGITAPNIVRINTGLFREKISSKNHLDPSTRDKFGQLIIKKP